MEYTETLSPKVYRLLAVLTSAIGLACSWIKARFFIVGLKRTENDGLARDALIAAGILMIVVELAAFGLAALLPRRTLRALRLRLVLTGVLLLGWSRTAPTRKSPSWPRSRPSASQPCRTPSRHEH